MKPPINFLDDHLISTSYQSLDNIIEGFRNSGLYTIAGSPGIGKTTLLLSLIHKISNNGISVGLVSYEMTKSELLKRILAIQTEIGTLKLSKISDDFDNNYLDQKIAIGLTKVSQMSVNFLDSVNLKIDLLIKEVKELKQKNGLEILFIDDIQRIPIDAVSRSYAVNREQEISSNVRELKALAKELDIPVVIISQLNRLNDNRNGDKRPFLIDLRDSGAIENDSDVVIFLYRPEHFGFLLDEEGNSNRGATELIVSKNRHGLVGTAKIEYNDSIPVFRDYVNNQDIWESPSRMSNFDDFNLDSSPF